jgi:hypothetical protein
MNEVIPMTPEQIKDYGVIVGQYVLDNAKSPVKEPSYKTSDPELQKFFPELNPKTLREWCRKQGKRKGVDGHYRVKLSEIERTYSDGKSITKKFVVKSKKHD